MKPNAADILSHCPSVDPQRLQTHLDRLGDDYFAAFSPGDICRHVNAVARLSPERPVQLLAGRGEEDRIDCTVIARDYPAEFSLITGVLAATGFGIVSGEVFTYRKAARAAGRSGAVAPERYIVDAFSGRLEADVVFDAWQPTAARWLTEVLGLLSTGPHGGTRARQLVNERVAERLRAHREVREAVLYPVEIEIPEQSGPYTTLRIRSQDTPAFLYALSNALSVQGLSIERVRIRTAGGRVEDEISILDVRGGRIRSRERLDRIRLSALLTKQFTYSLTGAADPYAALSRFEMLSEKAVRRPDRQAWLDLFSDAGALRNLARILGTSDFLWEDFVRAQYEMLLPLIGRSAETRRLSFSERALRERLDAALEGASGPEGVCAALNEWKDREIFLIDVDHIVHAGADVRALAEPLTRLAELVIGKAVETVYDALAARFGSPRTVGGLAARFAVFGLGKFGGVALGYASDIELLFLYGDNGTTNGSEPIANSDFFERVAGETARFVQAKREGIFHVDLRLRPHGISGPKACSLESFCRYYGPGGPAHSYERLALTRLRAVAGDPALGSQVERLRDEFVYETRTIRVDELRQLRERQFEEKAAGERYNVKFGPGALVDLEYSVQILQVLHGGARSRLRTPRLHEALEALSAAGVLNAGEGNRLRRAYDFLRRVINALRMLRGNARDLLLPDPASPEYVHLARRMGYETRAELDVEKQLFLDFETHTAVVRAFLADRFGREALSPQGTRGNVADLILSHEPPSGLRRAVLEKIGFADVSRAYRNLRRLAGEGGRREGFARLAILGCDMLRRAPDADMALNNWERFAGVLADAGSHFETLLSQPRRLEILLGVFAGSQFLSDVLVRYPQFLEWVTNPGNLHGMRDRPRLETDLCAFAPAGAPHDEWMDGLRRFRRREMLRIGARDICLRAPLAEITADLSSLADTLVAAAWEREWRDRPDLAPYGCLIALGKLGGRELNYSSDIDLLAVYDDGRPGPPPAGNMREVFARLVERVRADLSSHTAEGYAYRVDLRLRPHGRAGELVQPLSALQRYYRGPAALWEIQALLKARPVAGSLDVALRALRGLEAEVRRRRDRATVIADIGKMRRKSAGAAGGDGHDVKTGPGGIRDIEFLVQGLQLVHLPAHPELLTGNTLVAIGRLVQGGVLTAEHGDALSADYALLRRTEHCLQILEDRRIHSVPRAPGPRTALARRVLGVEATGTDLESALEEIRGRTRALWALYME